MSITLPQPTPCEILKPDEVAAHYNFPDNNGEGVTVGILAWGAPGTIGVDINRVTQHLLENGKSAPNYKVVQIGNQSLPVGVAASELGMDTTIIGWYLSRARQINIYIAEPATAHLAIDRAVADGCSVTTCSFGIRESVYFDDVSVALENAAQHGVTTCFAAGDSGAGSGWPDGDAVVFPAGDPHALAVGGTFIPTASPVECTPCGPTVPNVEQVWWNYPDPNSHQRRTWWGSGGGVSQKFPVPAYQESINPTSFPVDGQTYHGRGVPDVAAFAQGNSDWIGTSAATPTFAALIARINSALGTRVGDIHDIIYAAPTSAGAFKSIDFGCNIPPQGQNNAGLGYRAQLGWDACTGLGIPDGRKLMALLEAALKAKT